MTSPLRIPPALHTRSRVGILSPSGPVLDAHLEPGLNLLRSWQFSLLIDPQTFARHPTYGYLAGTDETRLRALQAALDSPDLDALIFARGGYGAMRLLPHLDPAGLIAHPKFIVGFSDITAILMWCMHRARLVCLHAPVVKSLAHKEPDALREASARSLHEALTGSPLKVVSGLHTHTPGAKAISGRVIAGNLSLIQALLGTEYLPTISGCILILEDVTEPDYRLDRLLTSLRLRSIHAPPAAIVLGEFLACGGVYIQHEEIPNYLVDIAMEFNTTVCSGFPTGHGAVNHAIPVGAWGTIDPEEGTLRFDEAP